MGHKLGLLLGYHLIGTDLGTILRSDIPQGEHHARTPSQIGLLASGQLGSGQAHALSLGDEVLLGIEQLHFPILVALSEGTERRVGAVGQKLAQLGRVGIADAQIPEHLVAQRLVQDRPGDFDALVHVARHEVGAGQVQLAILARAEAVHAAVLEQLADDGHLAHPIGVAFHPRQDAGDAAHEQIDGHARLGRLDQFVDDLLVGDGIRLEEQPALLTAARALDLHVDVAQDVLLDHERRHPQDVVVVRGVLQRHVAEEVGSVVADLGIAGDEREVGVELRRLLVVVARAQLGDVLQAVFRLARDGADLRVHLEVAEAVDDVAAGGLEALGPLDVVGLVEAGTQLEKRRDLLAVLGGVDEGLGQMRLARQAVQRDLDGNDGRIHRGLAQKLHESVHGLVGVRQQHLVLAHLLDDGALAIEAGGPLGRERCLSERGALIGPQTAAEAPGVPHVQRYARDEQLVLCQAELFQQKPLHRARERPFAFQAHRGQAAALLQNALHVLAVVLALLFGTFRRIEVGVARHADDVGVLDGVH